MAEYCSKYGMQAGTDEFGVPVCYHAGSSRATPPTVNGACQEYNALIGGMCHPLADVIDPPGTLAYKRDLEYYNTIHGTSYTSRADVQRAQTAAHGTAHSMAGLQQAHVARLSR